MRKQLTIATLIIATLFMAVSCQKNKSTLPSDTGKVNIPTNVQKISGEADDAGDVHHALRSYVITNHGDTSDVLVLAKWYVEAYNTIYDAGLDVDNTAQLMLDHAISIGMFDSDHKVIGGDNLNSALISGLPTSSLKTALTNINNNTDTGTVFLSYVSGQMSGLSALTGNDALNRDGYNGILNSSHDHYDEYGSKPSGKTEKQIKESQARIAKADANGWSDGFTLGMFLGLGVNGAITLAKINAAWDSHIQTSHEQGRVPAGGYVPVGEG